MRVTAFILGAGLAIAPGHLHAQVPDAAIWEVLLGHLSAGSRRLLLSDRVLDPGRLWSPEAPIHDAQTLEGFVARGVVAAICSPAACMESKVGSSVVVLARPVIASDGVYDVHVLIYSVLRDSRRACNDTLPPIIARVIDFHHDLYRLARRGEAWVVAGRNSLGGGHGADSLSRVALEGCKD